MHIQALIAHRSVETFLLSILPGLAWVDIHRPFRRREGLLVPIACASTTALPTPRSTRLSGHGAEARHERRETFRSQACAITCSARRDTPLSCLKTPSQPVGEVLTAVAQGLSVAAAVRVFGHRHATITTWVTRAGEQSALLHTRWLPNLDLPHIQLDELRTRLGSRAHILWLWLAVDPISKLMVVLHLGSPTQDSAYRLVHELREQLAPGGIPLFTSDGLNQYFSALTAHFGQWAADEGRRARQWRVAASLIYGQLKKT